MKNCFLNGISRSKSIGVAPEQLGTILWIIWMENSICRYKNFYLVHKVMTHDPFKIRKFSNRLWQEERIGIQCRITFAERFICSVDPFCVQFNTVKVDAYFWLLCEAALKAFHYRGYPGIRFTYSFS